MRKNNFSKFNFLVIMTIIYLFTSNFALAHTLTTKQGSEKNGYITGPPHPATNVFTFHNETATSSNINACRVGRDRWVATGLVKITETNKFNTANYIYEYTNRNTSTIAYNSYWYNTKTFIISQFSLNFNNYYMSKFSQARNNQIATHEWGHTFGLKDLYDSSNIDKIMYDYGNVMKATTPTASDKTGAKIGIK